MYIYFVGKRTPYQFGLGKREPYAFGLGKKEPNTVGELSSFSLKLLHVCISFKQRRLMCHFFKAPF